MVGESKERVPATSKPAVVRIKATSNDDDAIRLLLDFIEEHFTASSSDIHNSDRGGFHSFSTVFVEKE